MAIFKSTAFSKLKKSFGNLTTYRLKGQNVVKEKVTEVANPRTLAQRMQRLRMKTLVEMCDVFAPVIDVGFPQHEVKMTPDNFFVQLNQDAVEISEQLAVTIVYKRVMVSKGARRLPDVSVVINAEEHQLDFTHDPEKFARRSANDDQLYAAVLEREKQVMKLFSLNKREDNQIFTIILPDTWDMDSLVIYVFIQSKDKKQSSNSKCLELA